MPQGVLAVQPHRLLTPWGDGSATGGTAGTGTPAQAGDATWHWSDCRVTEWRQRGGDFAAHASASTLAGPGPASCSWSSTPGLVADLQGWLDRPGNNFGWSLVGAAPDAITARRFDSLQSTTSAGRPLLVAVTSPVSDASTALLFGASMLRLLALRRRG